MKAMTSLIASSALTSRLDDVINHTATWCHSATRYLHSNRGMRSKVGQLQDWPTPG